MNDASGWRVVLFTDLPGGRIYHQVDEILRSLGHRIVGVVTTPGPRHRRSSAYLDVVAAVRPGIDVIVSSHPERLAAMLAPFHPDLIITGGFPWLVPGEVIDLPRRGAINMHPSLLPRHRGPHSIEWALRNDDPEIGFSIHHLAGEFDTGHLLAQGAVPILDDDTARDAIERLLSVVPALLAAALDRLARGEPGEPQDEALATYAGHRPGTRRRSPGRPVWGWSARGHRLGARGGDRVGAIVAARSHGPSGFANQVRFGGCGCMLRARVSRDNRVVSARARSRAMAIGVVRDPPGPPAGASG